MTREEEIKKKIKEIKDKINIICNDIGLPLLDDYPENEYKIIYSKQDFEEELSELFFLKAELKGIEEGKKIKISEIYKNANPEIDLLKTAKNNYEEGMKAMYKLCMKAIDNMLTCCPDDSQYCFYNEHRDKIKERIKEYIRENYSFDTCPQKKDSSCFDNKDDSSSLLATADKTNTHCPDCEVLKEFSKDNLWIK